MKRNDTLRIYFFLGAVTLLFGLIGYKLFLLSYVKHDFYAKTAQQQTDHINNLISRGNVYFTDKTGAQVVAATNKKFPAVGIIGSQIDPATIDQSAQQLAVIVGLPADQIATAMKSKNDSTRILPKYLEQDQADRVTALGIKGVSVNFQMDRFYPNGTLGSDVLGFLGYSGDERVGQYGVESFYNQTLTGQHSASDISWTASLYNKFAQIFSKKNADSGYVPAQDIVLTIDKNIQSFAEDTLTAVLKKWSAPSGSIIVQEPTTGKILAMVDFPNFNPNIYKDSDPHAFINSSVQEIFEPGSSFKPVTMSAGLDLGKITPATTYVDAGYEEIDGYKIKNFSDKVFGKETMGQVLEKSINTGTMFVEKLIGDQNFLNYVINFGFGQQTGIDLPGEVSGDVSNLYSGRKINFLTSSFGQGIAVTPLQLINAYSAIANGGKLMKPYIVEKVISPNGQEKVTQPEVVGIPITPQTSAKLRTMLVGVVDNGFDKARISGYDIAGKTGTAQIADAHGGYTADQYIHSFLGFAPASDPKFVIMIKMDRPQGITFASDSLSPVFRQIAAFLINYYNIPPTR